MKTLTESLATGVSGMFFGNRLMLPFHCELLKVIIEDDIITDFSRSATGVSVHFGDTYMDVYCMEYDNLKDAISEYEAIKVIAVDKGADVFNPANHQKFAIYLQDKHLTRIEKTDQDILFIE